MRYLRSLLTLALALASSGGVAPAAQGLQVVTTTTDLAAITRAVAGEHAEVASISSGKQDPHFLQAKPSFIMRARRADLWIRSGLELEVGWEGPVIDGSRNRKIRPSQVGFLDASAGILRLGVPTGKLDRSMGDVHPMGNPHYWLDPYNGRVIARNIRDRLKELTPAHAEDFEASCAGFIKALDEAVFGEELVKAVGGDALWELEVSGKLGTGLKERQLSDSLGGWMAKLHPYRDVKILTYHKSWVYFANRFGLNIIGELEPKPGIPPSPRHLASVIKIVKAHQVKLLLVEPFYEAKAPAFVAEKTGLPVVRAANTVGGQAEATDYIAMLGNVVARAEKALSGKEASSP